MYVCIKLTWQMQKKFKVRFCKVAVSEADLDNIRTVLKQHRHLSTGARAIRTLQETELHAHRCAVSRVPSFPPVTLFHELLSQNAPPLSFSLYSPTTAAAVKVEI